MDAGVVSNFRPQAFASRTAAERFCYRGQASDLVENSRRLTPFFSSLLDISND